MKNNYFRSVRKTLLIIILGISFNSLFAQLQTKLDIKESIEGICNEKEVYALFPYLEAAQVLAESPISKSEILKTLNSKVDFLSENKKFKSEGIVSIIINCKGEVVSCEVSKKTTSPKLDNEIERVFNNLGDWKNATYKNKAVDSYQLFYFKVKRGKISWS
jgi:hypothetical protein